MATPHPQTNKQTKITNECPIPSVPFFAILPSMTPPSPSPFPALLWGITIRVYMQEVVWESQKENMVCTVPKSFIHSRNTYEWLSVSVSCWALGLQVCPSRLPPQEAFPDLSGMLCALWSMTAPCSCLHLPRSGFLYQTISAKPEGRELSSVPQLWKRSVGPELSTWWILLLKERTLGIKRHLSSGLLHTQHSMYDIIY